MMPRSLILASALLLAADAGTTALSPVAGLSWSSAEAADFTGKIKNIRIKRKRVGSGFKVLTDTSGGSPEDAGSIQVTYTPVDGGPEVVVPDMEEPTVQQWLFSIPTELTGEGPYTLMLLSESEEVAMELEPGGAQVVDSSGQHVLRARMDDDGWISLNGISFAVRTDAGFSPDSFFDIFVDLSVSDAAGDEQEVGDITLSKVSERFVSYPEVDGGEDPTGYQYEMSATLLDAAGEVTDSLTERLTLTEEGVEDVGVQTVSLANTPSGRMKFTTVTNSWDGGTESMSVQVLDAEESVLVSTEDTEPAQVERWFQVGGVEFDSEDEFMEYTFHMTADMIDNNGDPFGEQQEFEVSVDGLEARTAPNGDGWPDNTIATFSFDDGAYLGTWELEEDGTITTFIAATGEDAGEIGSIHLTFEGPFEGGEPDETELYLPMALEWQQWVQWGASAEGALSVSMSLHDEGGEITDAMSTTHKGGDVYTAETAQGPSKYGDILIDGVPLEFD